MSSVFGARCKLCSTFSPPVSGRSWSVGTTPHSFCVPPHFVTSELSSPGDPPLTIDLQSRRVMTNPMQRRTHPRNRYCCFARYRMAGIPTSDLDLLCVTRDFSHDGLYFLALSNLVRLNSQLFLKFPYLADSSNADHECLVEVVRVQNIFPGRSGVGVRLIGHRGPEKVGDRSAGLGTTSSKGTRISIDLYI